MSDTPRTDSLAFWTPCINDPSKEAEVVMADDARQLERELTAKLFEALRQRNDEVRIRQATEREVNALHAQIRLMESSPMSAIDRYVTDNTFGPTSDRRR